ncbi:ragulator complex protein LAMTOR1-like [Passer domesticus]|uniref:ragulator complex protein LAMTOR1-like n=1 Tax=Passer domesticus TaxID=48849 RepID=UPI0030FF1B36
MCQGHCPPSGSFFLQVAACQAPQSPDQPPASCSLCLPPSTPGQLWANSPWHFLPGEQPVQPGTLVASWQHSLGKLGFEMFDLGCWTLSALVRGCSEMGRELSGSNEPSVGATVSCLCSNIIDVSAADSQGMEQHEYMDRARQYSTRLAMLSNNLTHWKKLPLLPSLTNQPHQVLASDPVPFADLQQVSRIAAYAFSALSQIRVDAKEELVVQFGIP